MEDMFEETEKDMETVAIKARHPRVVCEGEGRGGMSPPTRTMVCCPKCKINSKYRLCSIGLVGDMLICASTL